jgi:hypothetical protein
MPFFASRLYLWGLVYSAKLNGEKVVILIPFCLLKENEMQTFYYKPIPSFYVSKGNAEIDFF